jgi:Holliday junction resolvasome RuvABC endonuclease subunit
MPKTPPRILAVNPGSRYIGIAVFRGFELSDWGVKVVSGKTPSGKLASVRAILRDCVERYDPDVLAIKRLHRSRSSRRLNDLVKTIKQLCRRRGIKIYQYSIQDVKGALCPPGRANKRKLAEVLAATYPVLAHELQRERQRRNPYHVRMFEAVALGTACYRQIENH